jgi:hypothetical protein
MAHWLIRTVDLRMPAMPKAPHGFSMDKLMLGVLRLHPPTVNDTASGQLELWHSVTIEKVLSNVSLATGCFIMMYKHTTVSPL